MSTKHCLATKDITIATEDAKTATSQYHNISSAMYLTPHGINHTPCLLIDVGNTLQREGDIHSCCSTNSLFPQSPAIILFLFLHPLSFAHLGNPIRLLSIQPYSNVSPTIPKHRQNLKATFPQRFTKRRLPGMPTRFPAHYSSRVFYNLL